MRIINEKKRRYEIFDSLGEFSKLAIGNPNPESSDGKGRVLWYGNTTSLAEACNLASDGWHEIRPDVDAVLVDLQDRLAERLSNLYVTEYANSGAGVDMGRFMAGEPECMMEFMPQSQASMGRVVKIMIAGTASHDIDADDIKRRGIAVLALVDTIHKMGVGIELWWESCVSGSDSRKHSTVVKLHDSNDALDIDSVMFSIAHPAMLRRLTFSVQEQSQSAEAQGAIRSGGYGHPQDMEYTKQVDFDVVVEKLQNGSGDIVRNPFAWVMATVQGLGLGEE